MINEKQKEKLFKALKKMYPLKEEHLNNIEDYDTKDIYLIDSNVVGIKFEDSELNTWFNNKFNVKGGNMPELNYYGLSESKTKIGQDYFKLALNLFNAIKVNPIINVAKDYPITLEAEDLFKVIIAPVVENF